MKKLLFTLLILLCVTLTVSAQRKQNLGRGVVATCSGTSVTVTWRRLIQDPEDARYNIYVAKNGTSYTKVTANPVRLTNYVTSTSVVPDGASIYVTMVDRTGKESAPSVPFTYRKVSLNGTSINNAYLSVNYSVAGSPLDNSGLFTTKFCWPVDLDGDGEMEYVVDRIYTKRVESGCDGWGEQQLGGDCLEAYDRNGKHLWTVDLGINTLACKGQNDGITVGDFDGDGKGEVIAQMAEGARFWDVTSKRFGKYLFYNGTQAAASGSGTVVVSSDGSNPDIDKDGVTNYTWYTKGKNPQYYYAVINGETGAQKDVCAMTLPKDNGMSYTRSNRTAFFGDEYPYISPAMGTAYLDGVNQSAVAQFQCRTSSGAHHYFTYAYGYEAGRFSEKWIFKFTENGNPSEFHHIRIGDVDGDGKDEIMNGACAVDHDGTLLWNSRIAHGDRFRLSDIDPDRPGQEIFAIQQNAPDMLGQILYDATSGEAIKKWYLSAVGDVGRGECMDVDASHKGYEMWSTMENIYDAKGDAIGTAKPYPYEGIWWDGDLGRESVMTSGSGNNCPIIIGKYNNTDTWQRLNMISRDANWMLVAENAVRAMFWGDIYGDWREELVLKEVIGGVECGFCCLTTEKTTTVDNIYCLLQDPNYFGQITNRGYYQSPCTGFYLGYEMPRPQLPPFVQSDNDNAVYGLTLGNATVSPSTTASNHFFMPVKGQTLTLASKIAFTNTEANNSIETLSLTDEGTARGMLWKSQQGTLIVNTNLNADAIVSEGTMEMNGKLSGVVDLRARGVLTGSGTVDSIAVEGSLNYAEGVICPKGIMTVGKGLSLNKKTFIEIDIDNASMLKVNGNLAITAPVTFSILSAKKAEGEYKLIEYGGTLSGSLSNLSVRGMTGLSYNIIDKDNALYLRINGQREPASGVQWTGSTSAIWDYQTLNWQLDGEATSYVANDSILFNDEAKVRTITLNQLMPVGKMEVNNTVTYTFNGNGGLSGKGSLIKNGKGGLTLNTVKSDYTGATIINEGTVTVKELADAGIPSSIGAATAAATNLQIGKATLNINNTNTGTNRGVLLNDTATIHIPTGTVSLKGQVRGSGTLRKTGSGQLNITYAGSNAWAGTILEAGTLAMGAWNTTFGSPGSPLHVTGNTTITMFDNNSSSTMPNLQNAITIDTLKTLTLNVSKRCYVKGSLLGKGTIKVSFPYVRGDVYTDVSRFEGVYDVLTSNCRFVQGMNFRNATLLLEANSYAGGYKAGNNDEVSYTNTIGKLRGKGTLGKGTWTVYDLAIDDKVSSSTIGNLTWNGSVVIPEGATVNVHTSTTYSTFKNDTYVNNGTLLLKSPHFVVKEVSTIYKLADNKEIPVFTGTGTIKLEGKATFTPVRPKDGWVWDTSKLATEGKLAIKPAPYVLGDANGDGSVTISDANLVVNYVLGKITSGVDVEAADVDGNGILTVSDANSIVNIVLGK